MAEDEVADGTLVSSQNIQTTTLEYNSRPNVRISRNSRVWSDWLKGESVRLALDAAWKVRSI